MTAKRTRLRAVPSLVGKTGFDYRFDVASQVIVPLSGPGKGQLGVRVGRLLVVDVSDRVVLGSFSQAWGQAAGLADKHSGLICRYRGWASRSQLSSAWRPPAACRGPSSPPSHVSIRRY